MPLYEIVREDEVVVFQHSKSRVELEKGFLLAERMDNTEKSFVVYTLNEDLKRVGRKKSYISYNDDKDAQEEFKKISKTIFNSFFDKLFEGNVNGEVFVIGENNSENS